MQEIVLPVIGSVAAWRAEASARLQARTPPEALTWRMGAAEPDLFATERVEARTTGQRVSLPRQAVSTLELSLSHRDPERFARAYDVAFRMAHAGLSWGDRRDAALREVLRTAKLAGRAIHKMHAFVRFRELPGEGPRRSFAAWFEPDHPIVEAASPFFARRFGDMDWTICTPGLTALFVDGSLSFRETEAEARPPADASEELWRTYFASIFNPARLKVQAMQSEMPKKYWRNLPEAELIPELIRSAPVRAAEMQAAQARDLETRRVAAARQLCAGARVSVPAEPAAPPETLAELAAAAGTCARCPLHEPATQTVFGEGPEDADLMVVGEQPGDQEDLTGRPFVGPAGQLFDRALAVAGLDCRRLYITNAVKHFKFMPRGKLRIHQRPNAGEVDHCRWWLDAERRLVRPRLTLALGATAARALTGSDRGLLERRGTVETARDGGPVLITVHPSYLLRLQDPAEREEGFSRFCEDLSAARLSLPGQSGVATKDFTSAASTTWQ
ncbi:UdgX family uracil-DNA binding protein [Amaricoccus macauensis]|uniref:UdgX family uracil-DNA binding protein n=1 Tax=Amaricoccus macauensis TaxID=57001 RepID=UPI003C7CFC62